MARLFDAGEQRGDVETPFPLNAPGGFAGGQPHGDRGQALVGDAP